MAEKHPHNMEHYKQPERLAESEHVGQQPEKIHKSEVKEHAEQVSGQHLEAIKHEAKKHARSGQEIKVDKAETEHTGHHFVSKDLKSEALQRTMRRTRKHLSPAGRTFSKVIHSPVIDSVSKVGEKTIARPKGIVAGAIVALAGSSWVLYSAKHYGFTYNYWVVFILFVGGYAVGLVIELLWFFFQRLTKR